MFRLIFSIILATIGLVSLVHGHGMILDPVGRSSRWRYDSSAPINYDDSQLYCGGYVSHWVTNEGKCGLCGDSYSDPVPRPNEHGGLYGQGVIVETYKSGQVIPIAINITANHRGYFYYEICNMDVEDESEECFAKKRIHLETGEDKYVLQAYVPDWYNTTLQLPNDLKCEHCVLRWTYRTGNAWGICEDGHEDMGCGPQEYFKACADISITA